MIAITQEEFEAKIQLILDNKTSRAKLIKELETDSRTLNNKIQELSIYNPDLYLAFIKKFPYKTKDRNDIDYEALAIEIIKNSMHTIDAARKYGIGERTINRRMKALEKENPALMKIYRSVKENNKHGKEHSLQLQMEIGELVLRPVKVGKMNEERRKYLEEFEKTFNSRCEHTSKEEAARSMGITANRMYKLLNELYRIRIEENHQTKLKEEATFKESLKVNSSVTTIKSNINENSTNISKETIGQEL